MGWDDLFLGFLFIMFVIAIVFSFRTAQSA